MKEAHVFQHKYTGVQIFVYGSASEDLARSEFKILVIMPENWMYIGKKVAQ